MKRFKAVVATLMVLTMVIGSVGFAQADSQVPGNGNGNGNGIGNGNGRGSESFETRHDPNPGSFNHEPRPGTYNHDPNPATYKFLP